MDERRSVSQTRIDGRAAFACAAYLIGVGVTFLLERIGAPSGLVRVLGPIFALSAIVLIGALMRTTRIAAFYAADHAGAARYGAAAFAAIAASLIACASQGGRLGAERLASLAAGFLLAALIIGPLARSVGATSLRDVVSMRHRSLPLRAALSLAFLAIGVLITAAGYGLAADAMAAQLGLSRHGAIAAVGVVLTLVVAPGGLAGLFWVAAAGGGMMAFVLFLPVALRAVADASAGAPFLGGGAEIAGSLAGALAPLNAVAPSGGSLDNVAITLGAAILAPVSTSAFAARSAPQAARAGFFGAVLLTLFALALALGAPLWPAYDSIAGQSLRSSAILVSALICAAAGVQTASRATSAETAYGYENVLASTRLARSRGLALLAIVIGAEIALHQWTSPDEALIDATALSLGFLGAPLALTASARGRASRPTAAAAVSLATIAALGWMNGWAPLLRQAPAFALTGAAAGFVVGWAASLFGGSRPEIAAPARLVIEEPFDPAT